MEGEAHDIERVMVFIDGPNLYHGFKDYLGIDRIKADRYGLFCEALCGGDRRLIRSHFFRAPLRQQDVADHVYAADRRFLEILRTLPDFQVHLGRRVERTRRIRCAATCGEEFDYTYRTEKGVDVALVTTLLASGFDNLYDTAVIVSGDGDLAPAAHEVTRLKKRVQNAYFHAAPGAALRRACKDGFIDITTVLIAPCL